MEENQKKELIYERIVQIMKEIGAISKDSENTIQNFKYRGIDAVMNALQPALIRNRVVMFPEVLSVQRADRVTAKGNVMTFSTVRMRYRFVAVDDGSRIEVVMEGEGKLTINAAESPATPQPTQPAQPQPTQPKAPQQTQPKGPWVPATGDTSNAGLWIALLIGSLLAMLLTILAGRIARAKNK